MQPDNMAIEVRPGQQTTQFVHVSAANVDPPPERYRLGINARA
jgi:hypothetical protein